MPSHFERREPKDNIAWFYRLEIPPTLFGGWAAQLSFGWRKIRVSSGRNACPCPSLTAAVIAA